MLALQEEINQTYTNSSESILKKLYAQPLNGNATINVSTAGGTQIRIEIPACVDKIDEMEFSYTLAATIPTLTLAQGTYNNTTLIYGIDGKCETLFQRAECYMATSTNKFVDLSNVAYYHKEVSSLKNDFMKRSVSQRFNFAHNADLNVPLDAGTINSIAVTDGYWNTLLGYNNPGNAQPPVSYAQQQYLPLNSAYVTTVANPNSILTYTPKTYQFTYKLRDLLPDSIFAKYKYLPHKSNLIIVLWLNPVSQIVTGLYGGTLTIAAMGATSTLSNPTFSRPINPTAISLQMTNIFIKYYAEINPNLVNAMMNAEFKWVYPFIYQTSLSSSSVQNGCSLIIGNEGDNRLYRVYTSLFAGTNYGTGRDQLYNNNNLNYEKWDTNVELYINNDLIMRIVPGNGAGLYDDWKEYFQRYQNSSLNSGKEIENHGVVVYDFDCDIKNGSKWEYADNNIRGMILDEQVNINPRFYNVKQADGVTNFTQYIFAVIFRQCLIKNGEMLI